MTDIKPHPLNAPGDFYVEDGCCTACEVPFTEAPSQFKYDDTSHCYICRQPSTVEETEGMLNAIACADLQCIRYRGSDNQIFDRLAALGEVEVCDNPPAGFRPRIRNHVAFTTAEDISLRQLVSLFTKFLEEQTTDSFSYDIKRADIRATSARLRFAAQITMPEMRSKGPYDTAMFQSLDASDSRGDCCAYHENESSPGVSWLLQRWLAGSPIVGNAHWFTRNEWLENGYAGHKQPW